MSDPNAKMSVPVAIVRLMGQLAWPLAVLVVVSRFGNVSIDSKIPSRATSGRSNSGTFRPCDTFPSISSLLDKGQDARLKSALALISLPAASAPCLSIIIRPFISICLPK